jgi:hypothetical protein
MKTFFRKFSLNFVPNSWQKNWTVIFSVNYGRNGGSSNRSQMSSSSNRLPRIWNKSKLTFYLRVEKNKKASFSSSWETRTLCSKTNLLEFKPKPILEMLHIHIVFSSGTMVIKDIFKGPTQVQKILNGMTINWFYQYPLSSQYSYKNCNIFLKFARAGERFGDL